MKIYIIRMISLILSIATALMIYSFSADTAEESSNMSGNIADKVLDAVGYDKETMPPVEYEKIKTKTEFSIRKLAHFSEYGIFGCFLCMFFLTFERFGKKKYPAFLCSLGISVPYAVFDEWHQSFVPGRGPGFRDVLIDSSGALCGSISVLLVYIVILHFKNKRLSAAVRQ